MERADAPAAPAGAQRPCGPAGPAPVGTPKSVESMLREFSSVGPETPREPAGRPGASTTSSGSSPWPTRTRAWPTSSSLLDRLTQALARRRRHGGEVVVCHIDLDNLGEINLDLGYTTGNAVLSEMARRLTSVLRAEDTIGRVGGSELVVVVAVTDEQVVGPLLRRLQHTLDEPVTVGGQDDPAPSPPWAWPWPRTPSRPRTCWPGRTAPPGSAGAEPPGAVPGRGPVRAWGPGPPERLSGVPSSDREYRLYTKQEYRPYWSNPIPAKL